VPVEIGQAIGRLQNGFFGYRCYVTAFEVGAIDALAAAGTASAGELAARTRTDERALTRVLDALVAVGILGKDPGAPAGPPRYALEPGMEIYAAEAAGLRRHYARLESAWSRLAAAVRDGKPQREPGGDPGAYFVDLVGTLFASNRRAAELAAEAVVAGGVPATARVLDIGAGSGVWSLLLALRVPGAHVWALDHPPVLAVTRRFFAALGAGDRLHELPGNLRELDLGEAAYDVVILGHILHSEGPRWSQTLLARCARALAPGGTLVIGEFVADEARASRENPRPILFGVHMLLVSEDGGTFTLGELTAWLEAAGFEHVRTCPVPAASPVVLATRRPARLGGGAQA
jgi:SAM-dependent methyltransferase